MSVSHRYKNFGKKQSSGDSTDAPSDEALENEKLKAFEAGYQAGWDDSAKAESDSREKITAEFARNLQDMSFTYHEALAKLATSFEPVMRQIIGKLLPELVAGALTGHILEQLNDLIKEHAGQPIEIVVSPANAGTVETIAGDLLNEPFSIVQEPSLGDGQAYVKIGSQERQIDIDSIVSGVTDAMQAFFYQARKEQAND
ncbi:ABC transporter ATP-binding protein [Roseobacter ponti]|uniref:ABC transporter ATP-binding protein n=1 Tax=Roseobacter ponti TaxID=1891787 RepID=A0A858T160_9RHOB|nr:ABC transporter ATP-binding protein [Roseobacter ponti]QJF52966.1 ABC transporter ATP-binding protein [Roseobacter ponti]